MDEKAAQIEADEGDVKEEVEGAVEELVSGVEELSVGESKTTPELAVDTSEQTIRNKCVGVRANIENKIYRMFSAVYTHPSQCSEDDWVVFRTGEDTILVDKRTMAILSHFECQWLTAPCTSVVLEPNILAVACTPKE